MAFDPTTATLFQSAQSDEFDPSTATLVHSANALPANNTNEPTATDRLGISKYLPAGKIAEWPQKLISRLTPQSSEGVENPYGLPEHLIQARGVAKEVAGTVGTIADMVAGLPGMGASLVVNLSARNLAAGTGASHKEVGLEGRAAQERLAQEWPYLTSPISTTLGVKPEESVVGGLVGKVGAKIESIGDRLEASTNGLFTKEDTVLLADAIMFGLGARGMGVLKKTSRSKASNSAFSNIDWGKVPEEELRSGQPSAETVDSIIKDYAKKTGNSITETDVRTLLEPITRGMRDVELNAEQVAYDLMQRGAGLKEVEAIRKKNPLVGDKLDELMARREELRSGPLAEGVEQGEVRPSESIPQVEITGEGQAPDVRDLHTFNPLQAVQETFDRVKMNPELAKTVGVAGAGAVAGYTLAEEENLFNGVFGAAGALLLNKWRKSGALDTADYYLGPVSTRLRDINQALGDRVAIGYYGRVLREAGEAIRKTDMWKQELIHLPKEQLSKLTSALYSGTRGGVEAVLREIGNTSLAKEYYNVRNVLNEVGTNLKDKGILKAWREDYYPRIVTDYEGLLNHLGVTAKDQLTKLLDEAAQKADRRGEVFGDVERSAVIDSYLRSPRGKAGVGFLKERKLGEIPEELLPYYANPIESLHTYLERATRESAKADLFGKSLKVTDGKIDLESSLGEMLNKEQREGRMTAEQVVEASGILRDAFTSGERGMNPALQAVSNVTNIALLANIASAGRNLTDLGAVWYKYGLPTTIQAAVQGLRGKNPLSARTLGLAEHSLQEYVSQGSTARLLNTAFKASGFTKADLAMKTLDLNASVLKHQKLAATAKGSAKIAERWEPTLGSEKTAQLLEDFRNGRITPEVMDVALTDLTRTQPLTMAELPQGYAANPNGRFFYKLKTYQLKQWDLIRNDVYKEIKRGNVKDGITNLTRYAAAMLTAGVAVNTVIDWILGKPIDFEESIPEQFLKTVGLSNYLIDQARSGKPVETLIGMATPPVQWMDTVLRRDPSASRYIPVLGPLLYHHQFGGSEKAWVDRDKRLKREAKAEARALDPERFRAIEERRKARALEKGAQLRAQGVQ